MAIHQPYKASIQLRKLSATVSLLMVLLATFCLSGCQSFLTRSPNESTPQETSLAATAPLGAPLTQAQRAQAMYQEAWHAIYRDYRDVSFNGQDWFWWRNHYQGRLKDEADATVAIETMLASLHDDYTRFLPRRDYREQALSIDAHLVGVGMQITVKDGQLLVVAPLEETPAQQAGLQPGDQILKIDGHPTAGLQVEEAADRIRGPQGSHIRLTIQRGKKPPFTLSLQRQMIKVKSAFVKPVEGHPTIGYVRLNSFISETATLEMREALAKLQDKQAIILDLRGNYGGLLSNAIEVANLFIADKPVVRVEGRTLQESMLYKATREAQYTGPLVVLIDGGSASASEIVSGCLKDHHRATLIGTQTFGKGLVQKIVPLHQDVGVNITIARYLTPNGTDINHKGVSPDIRVSLSEQDFLHQRDPQLKAAVAHLQQALAKEKS